MYELQLHYGLDKFYIFIYTVYFYIYVVVGGCTCGLQRKGKKCKLLSLLPGLQYLHSHTFMEVPPTYLCNSGNHRGIFFPPKKVMLCYKDKTDRLSLRKSNFLNYKNHIISFCPLLMYSCLLYSTLLQQSHKKSFLPFMTIQGKNLRK